tara:strand:- start:38951 stop:39565 length:615 start_codon:yes stop_codon:yes gene_type:complete
MTAQNMGGLISIRLVRAQDVVTFPLVIDGNVTDELVLAEGAAWVEWFCTSQSAGLKSKHSTGSEGDARDLELSFTIGKDTTLKGTQLERSTDDTFIILYRDGNGQLKLFGSKERPVRFKFEATTGQNNRALNGFDCSFFYSGPNNTAYYFADDPEAVTPGISPVIIQWNDGTTITTIAVANAGDVVRINSRFAYTDFDINPTTL